MNRKHLVSTVTGIALAAGLVFPAAAVVNASSARSERPTVTTTKAQATTTTAVARTTTTVRAATSSPGVAASAQTFTVLAGSFRARASATARLAQLTKTGESGFAIVKRGGRFLVEVRGVSRNVAYTKFARLKKKGIQATVLLG